MRIPAIDPFKATDYYPNRVVFQHKQPFFDFLRGTCGTSAVAVSAPAENYILEERLSARREHDFLVLSGFLTAAPAAPPDWFAQHVNYTKRRVARRGFPRGTLAATFADENRSAWLEVQPAEDVVRVETIEGLCERAQWELTATDARTLVQRMLDERSAGQSTPPDVEARLKKWLKKVNDAGDSRPAFVAPFAEVEPLLGRADWADRLRNALGLGHVRATDAGPAPILLMQYSLDRVRAAYLGKAPAWAASPTVLDDVARQGPSPHFFPAPKSESHGYGFTVDLDPSDATWKREFLHAPIAYELRDIQRIGLVTTDVTDSQIKNARKTHRCLLEADLQHSRDVPPRP